MLTRNRDVSIRQLKELYYAQRNTHAKLHEMMHQLGLLGIEDNEPLGLDIGARSIVKLVEEAFECDISRRDRSLRTTFGRKAAAYLLRRYTKLNLKEISGYTGTKDHTTAIHNIKQANNLIETEDWFKDKLKRICQKIEITEN
jgi:chromosomal replication initiation ATPase DnaA